MAFESKEEQILYPTGLTPDNIFYRDFLIDRLSSYVPLHQSSVLEVGIGNGRFGALLGSSVRRYCGVDINESYVELARQNSPADADIEYKTGVAEKIPFSERFDVVLYAFSWHFLESFEK